MLSLGETNTEAIAVVATVAASLAALPVIYYKLNKPKNVKTTKESKFDDPVIVPVDPSFNWETQKPYPYRPYKKGVYKMTLAIRKLDPNDLICIEDTYLERINLRKKIFTEMKTHGAHETGYEALKEAYTYIFDFLMKRYPMYFKLSADKKTIKNSITNDEVPASPDGIEALQLLDYINRNMEEDCLLLLKNCTEPGFEDEYVLRVGISAFPAGFNPLEKINRPLTKIHDPVPGYQQKLQSSMNKFFTRISVNEYIVRNNWSIQTHANLCAPTGSHATKSEAVVLHPQYPEDLDFNKVFFRVEKQCFTRLPKTKADIMFIRTYTTSLMELRETLNDEEKEVLCEAIDGLQGDIGIYKRRVVWGEAAKAFIRGESNGSNPKKEKYTFVR